MRTSLLLLVLVVLLPGPAWADCEKPRPFFAPPSGSTLPANPVVFLFVPEGMPHLTVSATSPKTARLEQSPQPAPPAYKVSRVKVETGAAKQLELAACPEGECARPIEVRYSIDGTGWKRPPMRPIQVNESRAENVLVLSGGRKMTQTIDVYGLKAPAYRVEYAPSRELYQADQRSRLVLPYSLNDFFYLGDVVDDMQHAELVLGRLPCLSKATHVWSGALFVGVVALLPDGSETPLPRQPFRIRPPKQQFAEQMESVMPDDSDDDGEWGATLFYLGLFVAVIIGGVIVMWRAKKRVRRRKGRCVACNSRDIRPVEGEPAKVECLACGYVGRRDQGGAINADAIHSIHGDPVAKMLDSDDDD